MTTISAKVIADTIWPNPNDGTRITTLQLRYPRFIHSEFMTHRAFSRNASSSRAIPVAKLIQDVKDNPVVPIFWGKNQPGMQAREEVSGGIRFHAEKHWRRACSMAVDHAELLMGLGIHKQNINRLLEPFSHINVVVTATEWDNFFELRDHEDAEPHIQLLAQRMKEAMQESHFDVCDTHLPYISDEDLRTHPGRMQDVVKVSAARCARVSYMTHDNKEPNWDADLGLAAKLSGEPPHLSPFEHQARWVGGDLLPDKYANFSEWRSQRYCMERGWDF